MRAAICFVRHGHVRNHEEDLGLTAEGAQGALEAGRRLGAEAVGGTVKLFAAPSRRTRETATLLFKGIQEATDPDGREGLTLCPPRECRSIRNFGFRLGGRLMEPSRVYRWTLQGRGLRPPQAEFYRAFWRNPDPVGFWLACPSPYAESPQDVVNRLERFINRTWRVGHDSRDQVALCVTHSGPMRALLQSFLGEDPGELDYLESLILRKDLRANSPVAAQFRGRRIGLAENRHRIGSADRPRRDRRHSRVGRPG